MEALSSLTFKGSVMEAIVEAKGQKKLFVVYISGEDEESDKLNRLTWTDASVAESLSKYCVLLHLQAASVDATNFSAIYPYSSVPCIAAIGFSGTQVWKNEGFITAEDLASSLEKAWLGLHIQETTASIFSAALASQNSEQSTSSPSNVVLPSEGGTSDAVVASQSTGTSVQPSERKSTATSASTKENSDGTAAINVKQSAEPSNLSDTTSNQPTSSVDETNANVGHEATETAPFVQSEKVPIRAAAPRPDDSTSKSSTDRKRKQETVINKAERDINLPKSVGTKEIVRPKDEGEDRESWRQSSDVHLNIRLPDGANLQDKFSVTSTLRMVKDYVNGNQTTELGVYDLAVPYPRKVYSDQDLDKSLSELGLLGRQALIVVPRKRTTVYQRGPSYSESNNNSTDTNNGGYFAYLRRVLSYANPFSYFGGASSSAPEPRGSMEYVPVASNAEVRNNLAQAAEGRGNVRNRRPTTSRIGSNIHTLRHDEEDAPFGDGNAFWNGNSTQYGGESGGDSNDRR